MKGKTGYIKKIGYICLFLYLVLSLCWKLPVDVNAKEYKTVKVGYYQSKGFQEGDGKKGLRKGYAYEYLQKIASYTGWKYEYVSGNWRQLYQKLKNGEIDLLAGVSYQKKRKTQVMYPDYEMLKETFYIYKDCDDTSMKSGNIASYAGKKIGVVNDSKGKNCIEKWKKENKADIELLTYPSLSACADDFNEHKIDGFVSADNIVSAFTGISPIEMIGKVPYYLCVSKNEKGILKELNTALSLMDGQDSSYLVNLRNKYSADTTISIFLSKQEREWMATHPKVKVGYLKNYLPYSDIAKDGTVQGVLKSALVDIFQSLPGNYYPDIIYIGYENQEDMIKALKKNEVDIIFPVGGELPFAEQNGYQQSSVVLQAAINLVYMGDYSEEKLHKIAVNKNNVLQEEFTRVNYPKAEIIYCDSAEKCLKAVENGKAGATLLEALRSIKLMEENNKMQVLPLTTSCNFCFGVDYGNSDLLRVINHGISMIGDKYGLSHAYQYMGDMVSYNFTDYIKAHIWMVYLFIGCIIAVVSVIFFARYKSMKRFSEAEYKHNQVLQDALMKAHQASYAKRLFLNNMSHDIRTPLNAILGILEMDQKCKDLRRNQENHKKARESINQLLTMVDNMIEMSSLENGEIMKMKEEVNLYLTTQSIEDKIREFAKKKDILVVRENTVKLEDCPHVFGREAYIQEILQHILENAIKYNYHNGTVIWEDKWIYQSPKQIEYQCTISDTGMGMKESYLQHIFEPFSQERYDARTTYKGSGLGMAIVKMLVDQMNGNIEIQSEEKKGTAVRVCLPFQIYEYESEGAKNAEQMKKQEDSKPEGEKLQQEESSIPNLTGMHVLLVEDNDLNIEIAQFMLEDAGALVSVAKDGQQAVRIYEEEKERTFDIILMDIMMPVMNGYDATKKIRASEKSDALSIPIIATTACTTQESKEECLERGMNAFVEKPLEMQKLMKLILRFAEKQEN